MTRKIYIILILLILLVCPGIINQSTRAQEPWFRQVPATGNFTGQQINTLFQDHAGYVWIGTTGGLYRFDGISFEQLPDPDGLLKVGVSAIGEGDNNHIWVGLDNGNVLRLSGQYIPEPVTADSLPDRRITDIITGNNHRTWFGTYGDGIYYTDDLRLVKMGNGPHLSDNYIYSFVKDEKGRIWVGTDNGINLLDVDSTRFDITHITVDDGLPDFIIRSLEKDQTGNIWIGMHEFGVCRYNTETGKIETPEVFRDWPYGTVNDILALSDRLWIATNGKGLIEYIFNSGEVNRYESQEEINLSRIRKMMQDDEGNAWLVSGTDITLSSGNKLTFIRKAGTYPTDNIHALITCDDGSVWFANDRGVFRFFSNRPDHITKFNTGLDLSRQKIMSLHRDPFGFLWIGTFGQGLLRLDPETGKSIRITEENGLVNGNVLAIKGTTDELWFATLGGASRVLISDNLKNPQFIPHFENFGKKEGLSNNFIYDLHIGKNNQVWFATDGSGVIVYENGSFRNLHPDGEFSNKVVYSVSVCNRGQVWMNVSREGIYCYDGDTTTLCYSDPDHGKLSFSGILINRFGEMVMAYDGGIDVMQTGSGDIIHFEENAGLADIHSDLNTLAEDAKGNVWIGTSDGIIKYNGHSHTFRQKPVTRINNVSVYLEEIDTQSDSVFGHTQNHFAFGYTGIWYQFPEKVFYRIKLEGHDLDWMKTRNNTMIYSNLLPGTYTFRVKSGLYNDFKHADEIAWSFTIEKPYWQTVWFYALIVAVLIIVIFIIIRLRERAISRKQEVIREKIKFQFENLKSQINPHFLFNSFSTLMALIETDTEEALVYVEELSALFRNVLEYKDLDVIPLTKELKIVNNYLSLQKKRFGNNLVIDIEKPEFPDRIKIPPLTLQLLIENAIKHNVVSKVNPLHIRIYSDISKGFIFVTNSLQLKKEVMSSTGIGIENIANRYRILTDREIRIEKDENTFSVGVPIIFEQL
ncbi:MAG: histidine kinase [Bacteroidales bacterium]|nr:histidine kinase [Bacteroidales bacterium]